VHHGDIGGQYVRIRCTERLAEAGMESSFGSVENPYGNILAKTINDLYAALVI
jgi:transposase InsO family protein